MSHRTLSEGTIKKYYIMEICDGSNNLINKRIKLRSVLLNPYTKVIKGNLTSKSD